jgi:hypothetical protein
MFNSFLTKLDGVLLDAKTSPHVVQSQYFPIYNIIEKYVKEHSLILSNAETLIKKEKTSLRSFVIYGNKIFKHANNISNQIAELTPYVLLYTNKKNEDFSLTINGTPVIQFFNVHTKIINAIQPVRIDGISMYPPELELISVYHKLYNPAHFDEWDKYHGLELDLRALLIARKSTIGGRLSNENSVNKSSPMHNIGNDLILTWIRSRIDCVLIGTVAVNIMMDEPHGDNKIQVITNTQLSKIAAEFGNLIFQYSGHRTTEKTHNINISADPRLQKTTITVTINHRGKKQCVHLIDIFNTAAYELVPYTTYNDIDIAYPAVLRMYQLVDLWSLRILFVLNFLNENSLKHKINDIFRQLVRIDKIKPSNYVREVYLGTNLDVVRFKKIQGTANVFYPYNPEQYRYLKGTYRKVT